MLPTISVIYWLNKLISIFSQLIIQSFKSTRHTCRKKSIDDMRNSTKTPLNTGLGNCSWVFFDIKQTANNKIY